MLAPFKGHSIISQCIQYACELSVDIAARKKSIIFVTIYAALSVFVMAHFLSSSLLGDRYYRTAYDAMSSGTAWKPFVYRVLMPKVTNSIVKITPESWQRNINIGVNKFMRSESTIELRQLCPWLTQIYQRSNPYPRLVTTVLIYLALWGYILMLYRLAAVLVPGDDALKWFAPIFGMLAISSFSRPWQYVYDIPVLFLSTACYYYLFKKYFRLYLFFFILACLNRETAIFIFLFFTIWSYKRLSTSSFVILWFLQCVIYASIKIVLSLSYLKNPGWFLENNLFRVVNQDLMSQASFTRIMTVTVAFFLLTYRWKEKPAFMKNALWLLPIVYGAYLIHGNPGEYRVFFDVLPLIFLMATHTLTQAAGLAQTPFFNASQARIAHEGSDKTD